MRHVADLTQNKNNAASESVRVKKDRFISYLSKLVNEIEMK